jgi:nitronate monooxygenase
MHKDKITLSDILGIELPIILAPMFLVSNVEMLVAASKAGITGSIPALNFRTDAEFRSALEHLKKNCSGPFGINLIVNKSNVKFDEQLKACVDFQVDYIITSLGSPEKTINECKKKGIKVFCDVTDAAYAKKVEELGADAVIAVNSEAGGHAGKLKAQELIPLLKSTCNIPVISAGGVATGKGLHEVMELGACGASIGSIFIASDEAGVSNDYKEAIVQYGAKDIVMTTRLSGTPCTVINTPYVQKIGTKQNWLESFLNSNKQLKKFAKMLTFYKGMKLLEKAAFSATYKTLWCAGPSIEHVKQIQSIEKIVADIKSEYKEVSRTFHVKN